MKGNRKEKRTEQKDGECYRSYLGSTLHLNRIRGPPNNLDSLRLLFLRLRRRAELSRFYTISEQAKQVLAANGKVVQCASYNLV